MGEHSSFAAHPWSHSNSDSSHDLKDHVFFGFRSDGIERREETQKGGQSRTGAGYTDVSRCSWLGGAKY